MAGIDHFRLHHPRPRGVLRTQIEVRDGGGMRQSGEVRVQDHKTIAAHRFNLLPLKSPWRWLGQSMRHNETSSWFISTCEGYMAWLERERESAG